MKSSVKQEILRFFHFVLSYLLANNDVNLKGQMKKNKRPNEWILFTYTYAGTQGLVYTKQAFYF